MGLRRHLLPVLIAAVVVVTSLIDGDLLAMVRIEFGLPWPILVLMLVAGYLTGRILQRVWPEYSPFRDPGRRS